MVDEQVQAVQRPNGVVQQEEPAVQQLQPTRLPLSLHASTGPEGVPSEDDVQAEDLDQVAQEQYDLEIQEALSLGYSVVNLSEDGNHHLLVFQAARFKDISTGGHTYRFGVALEAAISVDTLNFKGGLTLPVVAANVQLGLADASSTMSLRGYKPQNPISLPGWGSFDVSSYSDFQKCISDLQTVLFDNANIHPVLLATTMPRPKAAQRKQGAFFGSLFNRRNPEAA